MSASINGIAYPTDLKLLHDVFSPICREHGIQAGSPVAEQISCATMSLFASGVIDETELIASLEEFMRRKTST